MWPNKIMYVILMKTEKKLFDCLTVSSSYINHLSIGHGIKTHTWIPAETLFNEMRSFWAHTVFIDNWTSASFSTL